MATQNKCPYCGTSVSLTARYCDSCGTPLKQADRPAPPRRRERPHDRISVWVFIVVLFSIFATGSLGGYRYQARQWPWDPAVRTIASGEDPGGDSPAPSIPSLGSNKNQDPTLEGYLRSVVSINVRGEQGSKTGSGFIIDTGGHIVTSAHVVEGAQGCVNVIDDNGTTHLGTVVQMDRNLDVAMIYAPTLTKWRHALSIRQAPLVPGDELYVLGSPRGTPNSTLLPARVEQTGIKKRIDDRFYANLVEVKGATVVHGASGSPLLHRESGKVVGVVTAAADSSFAYAVPTDTVLTALLNKWAAEPLKQCGTPVATQKVSLRLMTITPLSGTYGIWGNDLASGVELALRDMEDHLRKVGYEVTAVNRDDQGNVGLGKELAKAAAYDQEVIGVVGSFTNQVSVAVAETLAESGLVMIAPTAGAEELTTRGWPHFNRIVASNARLEAAAAAFAKNQLQARSLLLLVDGTTGAESRASSFETSAQIISLPVAGRMWVPAQPDPTELKQKIVESGVDALFYAGNSQTGFQVVQALRQEGIMLPVISGTDLYSVSFENMTDPSWRSIYFTHFTDGADERFNKHFVTILGRPTRGYGMFGYDAARVILEALVRYGEQNPARVPSRAELAALVRSTREHPGWSSTITFDPATGENQAAQVYVFEWVSGHPELRE